MKPKNERKIGGKKCDKKKKKETEWQKKDRVTWKNKKSKAAR